ncbi:MAG: hypothetical protein J6K70_01180 [Selenomonadales bacterium]|nr:hypothetical protein [Selenomonadales bacterium]
MTKRLTAMLCALIFSLMSATAFAAEDSFHRDPTVLIKGWQQIAVQDVTLDDANTGDTFLADALTYELLRIGEDKLDDLAYRQDEDGALPDAYLTVEIKRYEKNRYWIEPYSDSIEQEYTHTESYRDREGNERTRYITRIETVVQDYPPHYTYRSYVHAKLSVVDAKSGRPAFIYEAIDDDDKSTIDIYRGIVKDFCKKWKKEMKK